MRKNYFDSISNVYGWLEQNPKKREVIANAKETGIIQILTYSCNRALTIDNGETVFLQSYDTIVLSVNKATKEITKHWNGYSKTTMKHINTFLYSFGIAELNKKQWEAL